MNQQLDELLHKKMNRQEFLRHKGLGVLVLIGLGSILKVLTPTNKTNKPIAEKSRAYGAGPYGA